ncbi:MAG: stress response translation initiation inhibitor YciH [Calditrichia bacterium]|nr:stress response translation initiation inhibitor YciH [Calditrichia bacterium]
MEPQQKSSGPPGKIIKIRREVKGRRGKTVTTLHGFNLPENQLQQVAGELKRYCGSGGSVKDGIIIIQGDQRQKVEIYLTEEGYTVKRDGG